MKARRLQLGALFAALAISCAAPAPLHAQVSQWNYNVNPATGNGRATYPGDVQVGTLSGGGCVQADASGMLGLAPGACASSGGVQLNVPQAWTATQTFGGSTSTLAAVLTNIGEPVAISATALTGAINAQALVASISVFTVAATGNWTINLRGDGTHTLNSLLSVGQAITFTIVGLQGSTAFYNSAVLVDGSAVTPFWQGGSAPSFGNPSGYDIYTYTAIKTGAGTWIVLASQTQF